MINLTIDGKQIKINKGVTILKAALDNDIYIPHLCWDHRLTPYGGCRLCMVEIKDQPRLFAACSMPAGDGMVVYTDTEQLRKVRSTVVELMLIHHPLDCPVCDKAGECQLQIMSFKYGANFSRFKGERKNAPEDTGSPMISRNTNRCVLCGKCVRVCGEHQGVGAINFIGRGFENVISPAFEETLDCEFCGQCVDACPVGALGSKPFKHRARSWVLESYDNICPYCSVGCTVTLDLREGEILRSRGISTKGINKGDLCGKGRYGLDFIYSDARLKTPMIRVDGQLKDVSWDEALKYIADGLIDIKNKKGADRIGAIGSPRCTVEDNYMLQNFMRTVIGTNNIDSSARFGFAVFNQAIEMAFGIKRLPIEMDAPLGKNVILVFESDVTSTHPVWGLKFLEAKQKGSKLIIVDSRETKLARHAHMWLKIKPGTTQVFIYGMIKLAYDEGLYIKEDAEKIENFSKLIELVQSYTPELVAKITTIDKDDFLAAASLYLTSTSRIITLTIAAAENNKGFNTIASACDLTNFLGDGPKALQSPAEYSNTFGLWQMGIAPNIKPGGEKVEKPGKTVYEMLYKKDEIDALFLMGEDPLITYPDLKTIENVISGLQLLIVQDIRLTETAKLAHVVLPASSWSEKDGTFINSMGRSQTVRKVIMEKGESLPDWQILNKLSKVMGQSLGIDNLKKLQSEVDDIRIIAGDKRLRYIAAPYVEPPVTAEYPFIMVTGNSMQHSGTLSVMSKSLTHVFSDAFIQVNTEDALKYGLVDGSYATLESIKGKTVIKIRVTDEVSPGVLFVPVHFKHVRVNELTRIAEDGTAPLALVKLTPIK
ncbi:MAG: molybdopterin-dependent oxidoreductase [Nitrospirae bacterium]|nr:molybdopterin-dependent oxidoreductase [Nitrospirota bacterium]